MLPPHKQQVWGVLTHIKEVVINDIFLAFNKAEERAGQTKNIPDLTHDKRTDPTGPIRQLIKLLGHSWGHNGQLKLSV